ncbi:hypothetical protein B0H12DRAFT_1162003 [Mycena haematopus]|nr:hypothetical protein B0H12DRAFT_1162003 [Mycena haematopus]
MKYTVDSGQFDSTWDQLTDLFLMTEISLLPFGIYINLFLLSIYILARRRETPGGKFLIAASCTMAVVGTTQIATTIAEAVLTTRLVQEFVHDEALNQRQSVLAVLATASHVLLAINVAVTDIFFMYRCYVIWGYRWKIIISPALLMLATLVTATIAALPSSSVSALVIPCGLTAATNIVLTTLTAGRILWISRQSAHVGLSHTYRSRYSRAIRIILESGALYCVAVIFLIIAASRNNLAGSAIGYAIGQQAVNIIPTFTLVYAGLHDAADNPQAGSGRKLSSTQHTTETTA